MRLIDGYRLYKDVQGKKYNEVDQSIKDKLKEFRNQFGIFTDNIFLSKNLMAVSNGKGMWQNSGNFTQYIWNRYKLEDDNDSNLVIYMIFSTKSNEGIFISIGLIDDKKTEFEKENQKSIYNFLEEQCKTIECDGFQRKNRKKTGGNEERAFFVIDENNVEHIDYSCILAKLKNVYKLTLSKFYTTDQDENLKLQNYKELYTSWMNKNSSTEGSNKLQSYLKAIEILSNKLFYKIFETTNTEQLTLLYEDLLKEQKNIHGKYYYKDAPSYGSNGFYSASIKSYIDFLNTLKSNPGLKEKGIKMHNSLNQILYGPPGTGKTYNTINRAIEIIENRTVSDREDRTTLKNTFEEYKKLGQIEFVTFHQSYGYEEFVEGIKAKTSNNAIEYKIESGIFKRLTKIARLNFENSKKSHQQLVDEKTTKQKLEIFLNNAFENDVEFKKTKGGIFKIIEFSEDEITIFTEDSNYSEKKLSVPIDEFLKIINSQIELKSSRQMAKDVFEIHNQRQRDTYYFAMIKEFNKYNFDGIENVQEKEPLKNYILIIDEINRGNISKIFGELITLIEDTKRLGADESIEITLPYSSDKLGIPNNFYILGTMNTADRSIALMDTALRRRFEFKEMMPRPELLNTINLNGISIEKLLITINERVDYLYDRDHTIGHAYFMSLKDLELDDAMIELNNIFRNKIIPLLQEYFYDDWEKIQIVLGDHPKQKAANTHKFIVENIQEEVKVLGFDHEDIDNEQYKYTINTTFTNEAYLKLSSRD